MALLGFAPVAAALLIIAGCAHSGRVVATYDPGRPALVGRAPRDGDYLLSTVDGSEYIRLRAKEPIGFRMSASGELLAIAGSRAFTVPVRHHCWIVAATGEPVSTALGESQANAAAESWQLMIDTWARLVGQCFVGLAGGR